MKTILLTPDGEPVGNSKGFASVVIAATKAQIAGMPVASAEAREDLRLSTDALNLHRLEWRLREEWGDDGVDGVLIGRIKARVCERQGYEPEEFEAALIATRNRARLPYGWTALDLATRRLTSKPVILLDEELEASRYARDIMGLAVHLQQIQGEQPILLPVEQIRGIIAAKKVVVAGTITKLIDKGLLVMTKAAYHTGSAREFLFKGEAGKDYVFRTSSDSED